MKKIIGLIMICVLSITPAYAAVESENVLTAPGTSETTVYADIDTEYTVTLPKVAKLDKTTKDSDYTVKVQGDIAGTDSIIVEPETSFAMHTDGKDDVTATVSQTKTKFEASEITGDGATEAGKIAALGLTAGSWNGSFNFNVQLKKKSGLYKADGTLVTWQQLLDDGTIKVQDGELTSGYTSVNTNTSSAALTGTLVIDDSVTSLGENALAYCTNLTGITIPDSVTTMKNAALAQTGIIELTIPASVTELQYAALTQMQALTTVIFNCSGDNFTSGCFTSSGNLKTAIFNGSYKTMQTFPGGGANKLTYLKLPNGLTEIPYITGNNYLETIVIPSDSITSIKGFSNCPALKELDLSKTEITEIPAGCFSKCSALVTVKLPDTLTTINNGAFAGCTDLDLTVPNTVTTIDTDAFKNVKHVTYNGSAEDTTGNNWGALALN